MEATPAADFEFRSRFRIAVAGKGTIVAAMDGRTNSFVAKEILFLYICQFIFLFLPIGRIFTLLYFTLYFI